MARNIAEVDLHETMRTPPLVMQIADQLERDIIAGRYAGGEWLREQEIADRLGTSRGPVREALRLVELDGLIEMVPWRGARVVDLTPAELDDLMEVVAALQGLVSRLAAAHGSDADFDLLGALIDLMEQGLSDGAPMSRQLRQAFEGGVLLRQACGSERAGKMLIKVGRLAYWQHRHLLDADRRWRAAAVRKWRALLVALRVRDGERADRAARDMVHHSKALIMATAKKGAPAGRIDDLPTSMGSVGTR